MKHKAVEVKECPDKYKNVGGRLFTASVLTDEVNPKCDPLGAENKMVFCAGLFGGTPAPCSGRMSLGFKSPLTNTIKECNSGGTAVLNMTRLGYKAIIIEEKAESGLYLLHVTESGAEVLDASEYAGMDTYTTSEKLMSRFGEKAAILSIGPGGEMGYLIASVQVTGLNGYPSRALARGGSGAVMGSKGLKAIVIDAGGKVNPQYADQPLFMENNKKFIENIKKNPLSGQALPAFGTAVLVNGMNAYGCLPTRNFTDGTWDKAANIGAEHMAELQEARKGKMTHICQTGCVISCSNEYHSPENEYLTSGLEYETIALFGSNLLIDDMDAVAKFDRACDEIGVDTMDMACTIGVYMESGKMNFGDASGALALMDELRVKGATGALLGQGTERVAKALGVKRCPTVKGQSLAAYDPRALKGTGVTYATSPMGADHTAGNTLGMPGADPGSKEGQAANSAMVQTLMCVVDSLGLCLFTAFCVADTDALPCMADMLSGLTGERWDVERVMGLGAECLKLERAFNAAAGITKEADRLPEFFSQEPLKPHGTVWDVTDEELASVFGA